MEKEILELQTKVTRQFISIDDVKYELLNIDEIGLKDYVWLKEEKKRLDEIKSEDMDQVQAEELSKALDAVTEKTLLAPKEIRDKLTDLHKMRIMTFFLKTIRRQSGEIMTSSPGSSGITEEVPANG